MQSRLTDVLTLLLAFLLPLAGVLLTLYLVLQGSRDAAIRTGIATLLGVALYVIVFS